MVQYEIVRTTSLQLITNSILIQISPTAPTTIAKSIYDASLAIAIPARDTCATAFVHWTGTVAHPTFVQASHACVLVVAHTVAIFVLFACAAALANRIQFLSEAIALPGFNRVATAFVDRSWAVAATAGVVFADAVVDDIAQPIPVFVGRTYAAANANHVEVPAWSRGHREVIARLNHRTQVFGIRDAISVGVHSFTWRGIVLDLVANS
jgi:hypothetical protein